jgi:predicted NBD/HSP70 family sugar kinase
MPGQIDADHGLCLRSNRLDWTNVPIARMIAEKTGVPAWADNDLNAFAIAEHLFGKARTVSSLAVATFGRGVGAALIVRGALHRGRTGAAAELGHMRISEDGPLCECGKSGCLEAYVGEPALLRQYAEETGETLAEAQQIGERAAGGDAAALRILDRAGRRLGAGIATLASLFDPEALVIGGEGVRLGRPLLDPLLDALNRNMFQQSIDVRVEDWGDDAWARGAAALAIDSFFSLAGAMAPARQNA